MTRTARVLRLFAAFAAVALLLAACNGDDADTDTGTGTDAEEPAAPEDDPAAEDPAEDEPAEDDTAAEEPVDRGSITVGSADFDENEIVASMYAEVLEDAGYTVDRQFLFGNRELYFSALEGGDLDLVPEYIGSAVVFLSGGDMEPTDDAGETTDMLRELVAEEGLEVLEPADATNANGFVVTAETAEEYDLAAISDLEGVSEELVLGGPPECPERPLCLLGLQEVYGLDFAEFQPLDVGGPVTVQALADGDIDVGLLFTTDESIAINDWVLLEDDQGLQPAENLVPVIRADVVNDEIRDLLNAISDALTTEDLTALNRRVRFDGEDPADVAVDWLEENGLL
jgi:osmoprotectant transport system substrate-binding protein